MPTIIATIALAAGAWIHMAGGAWNPTEKNVASAGLALQPYVTQHASARKLKLPEWSTYSFQYVGTRSRGRNLLYINAFCTADDLRDPSKQWILVFDGGPCFFSAYFDVRKKRFVSVKFNGFA
jgi:hypothetical protein